MKPNQVKGTVFSELDDERLYKVSPNIISAFPKSCSQARLLFALCVLAANCGGDGSRGGDDSAGTRADGVPRHPGAVV